MPRLQIALIGASLALAAPLAAARAQVNNGVGIGPSSELERPDLATKEHARAPTRTPAARHSHARPRATTRLPDPQPR